MKQLLFYLGDRADDLFLAIRSDVQRASSRYANVDTIKKEEKALELSLGEKRMDCC